MRLARRRAAAGAAALALALAACEADPTAPPLPPLAQLPDDLAAITFAATGSPSVPYVMLELRAADGFRGFAAVNGQGDPVWFFRTEGSPFSFTRRANGNFVLLDSERGLLEVTPAGEVVRELAQEPRSVRRMHHDVSVTARNTVLFIAEEWRAMAADSLNGEAIWEWTPETGTVERRWSAFDHLDPAADRGARSQREDWLHANSIAVGPSGNVLLGLHFLDQVLSIAPDFGRLEWRLGGVRGTIVVDDPFSGQHTAQEVAPDRVLLFDNGFAFDERGYSRAVEYELDGHTARRVWEWRPERPNWARVISGVRRLPNGHTLVGFGTPADMPPGSTGPIEVYEVDSTGRVVWHLEVGGRVSSMYRASPVAEF